MFHLSTQQTFEVCHFLFSDQELEVQHPTAMKQGYLKSYACPLWSSYEECHLFQEVSLLIYYLV